MSNILHIAKDWTHEWPNMTTVFCGKRCHRDEFRMAATYTRCAHEPALHWCEDCVNSPRLGLILLALLQKEE